MITTFPVPTTSIGRVDHSINISKSVTPISPSSQVPVSISLLATVPQLPYPFAYWLALLLSKNPNAYGSIPENFSIYGFNLSCTGDSNNTSFVGVQIYDRYNASTDVIDPTSLYDTIFMKFAQKAVELHATKGFDLKTYAGKYAIVFFNHYGANPMVTLSMNLYGLIDVDLIRQGQISFLE